MTRSSGKQLVSILVPAGFPSRVSLNLFFPSLRASPQSDIPNRTSPMADKKPRLHAKPTENTVPPNSEISTDDNVWAEKG